MASTPLTEQERSLVDSVSTDKLMASTTTISQWVRLSGTPEEARAFDWIEGQLRNYGLEVTRYKFPALVSWPLDAALTVTTADGGEHEVPCRAHAFSAPTPPEGLEGQLLYVGKGSEEELREAGAAGRIVLVDGIVAQNRNMVAEQAGVAGSIWIAGSQLHERLLLPTWGMPTPETAHLIPRTPSVSVKGVDGARIKAAMEKGPVRVKLHTKVFKGWKEIPVLIGDLRPSIQGGEADTFVMLSGHVDSWYYGAMDNGSANATMLEVARLLALRHLSLRRGLRVAFWSGHSHGRYAGSAAYGDHAWQDLHDHCVAHVNVDSTGARGATVLSEGNSMEELRPFASDVIEQIAGQRLSRHRYGRSGDQSFWGHGIPAMLMSLSEQGPEGADPVLLALHHQIGGGQSAGGGLGWWWHTPEDTVDKIDPEFLRRDTSIYAVMVYRLCTSAVLPLDYTAVVAELTSELDAIRATCGGSFDFSPVAEELGKLGELLGELEARVAEARKGSNEETVRLINRCLMRLGRALIPVNYTRSGPFDQDLAIPTKPLPGLQSASALAAMRADSDEYQFLRTRLTRERNRVVAGILEAARAVGSTLLALESQGRQIPPRL